jgi:2-desacetyl-2-hydroxyethyl bacteriochlorophyllide A dehydrogenase
METMLAARYLGPNKIETETVSIPAIGPGEALVKVDACGFCGSDINIIAGTHPRATAPLTVGHELAGHIVEIGHRDNEFRVGDPVTMFPLISCGLCHACTHGSGHVCRKLRLFGFDVDGGMAEFIKLPVSSLVRLPKEMPASIGALIEPLAVTVHGVARARLENAEVAVVQGAGPIGLLTALVLQAKGLRQVIISDVLPSRLQLAGSLKLQNAKAGTEVLDLVLEITGGDGADLVFECAGHPSSAREMTTLVRSRGTIVNLGVFKKPAEVDLQAINFKELEVVGSRVYERRDFEEAIQLAPRLPLDKIISHSFPIQRVSEAFSQFQSSDACKVLIFPSWAASNSSNPFHSAGHLVDPHPK